MPALPPESFKKETMSLIISIEHGLAAGFSKLKAIAKQSETVVLPALKAAAADDKIITAVANATGVPFIQASARVEESLVGWAINFIETAEKEGTDPAGVLGSLVADVKAIAPTVKAAALPVGAPIPTA